MKQTESFIEEITFESDVGASSVSDNELSGVLYTTHKNTAEELLSAVTNLWSFTHATIYCIILTKLNNFSREKSTASLQMKRLSWRNKRLRFKTLGNCPSLWRNMENIPQSRIEKTGICEYVTGWTRKQCRISTDECARKSPQAWSFPIKIPRKSIGERVRKISSS